VTTAGGAQRKLRILVLTSTFPRWSGDSEPRFILDLCRHLSATADVLVLAPHTPGAALEETLEGVPVRRFRYYVRRWQGIGYQGGIKVRLRENPWRLWQLPLFFFAFCVATRRFIRTWEPDVIHAHWIIPQALVACLAARRDVPILCTSHGGDLHGLRGALFGALKSWTLRRCRAATVVSDSMVTHVKALAPDLAVSVIPMGTDLSTRFVPPPEPGRRDANHIVFVGRLVEKKGVRHLLDAFALIATAHPKLRLTIAGDGPLRAELDEHATRLGIARRVTFLGGVEHAELPSLYQRATLAVFPFAVARDGDQEGFGLVVVEAMGCGCPVIAGDLPAIRQSIEPGVTGILTRAGDAGQLASAMTQLLADARERARLANAALQHVRESFDWTTIAAQYRETIDDLASTPDASSGRDRERRHSAANM
jgi:phosphatidyl-myo-inositol dimannoside synthase